MELETISCILCGRSDNPVAIEENGWRGLKCVDCSLIYISPRPGPADVVRLYAHRDTEGLDEVGEKSKRLQAQVSLRAIKSHGGKGSLLELGPGYGVFLQEARRKGFEVKGVELDQVRAAMIRDSGIPCVGEPLNPGTFGGELFDVVFHCDVISHLHDPLRDLQEMRRHVTLGGLMVFETGNAGDIAPRYYSAIRRFQFPDHLFLFSTRNFRSLLADTGFQLVEIRRYNQLPFLLLYRILSRSVAARPSSASPPAGSPAAGSRVRMTRKIAHRILHFIRYGLGRVLPKGRQPQTVVVVARAV